LSASSLSYLSQSSNIFSSSGSYLIDAFLFIEDLLATSATFSSTSGSASSSFASPSATSDSAEACLATKSA
jgi:hypothetical protein